MSHPVVSNIDPCERGVQPPSCGISNTVLAVAAALFAGVFVGLAVAGSMGSRSRLTARQASGSAVPMSIVDALRVELDAEHCVAITYQSGHMQ